jgi:hypothetical protein
MDVNITLVPDWRNAARWWSVRIATFLAALGPVWLALPEDVKAAVPVEWLPYVSPVVLLSIVLARVIDQKDPV